MEAAITAIAAPAAAAAAPAVGTLALRSWQSSSGKAAAGGEENKKQPEKEESFEDMLKDTSDENDNDADREAAAGQTLDVFEQLSRACKSQPGADRLDRVTVARALRTYRRALRTCPRPSAPTANQ